jgi:hypothetical protein
MFTTANRRNMVLGLGVFYTAIGALGFVPGLAAGQEHGALFGLFGASPMLSAIHVAVGLAAIWGVMAVGRVRTITSWLAAGFALLVGAAFAPQLAQPLAITGTDTIVHLVSLVLTAYVGLVDTERVTA